MKTNITTLLLALAIFAGGMNFPVGADVPHDISAATQLTPGSDNSRQEYALDGAVNDLTLSNDAAARQHARELLQSTLAATTDNPTRAFLLTELNKLATSADFPLYRTLLADPYLGQTALKGLCTMKGIDAEAVRLVNKSRVPDARLAYLAYYRRLPGVEKQLLKWAKSADKAAAAAAVNALTVCGSAKSIATLREADTDAYLQLLANLGADKNVMAEAEKLLASDNSALRCAGLKLLMANGGVDSARIRTILSDNDPALRATLLGNLPATAQQQIADAYPTATDAARVDILNWLGDNHVEAQKNLICTAVASQSAPVACAAIEAAGKIGGNDALITIIGRMGDSATADAARYALQCFNGDISAGILGALGSDNPLTLGNALALASERRMRDAYPAAIRLASSADAGVAAAAVKALAGVSAPDNFPQLAAMLREAAPDRIDDTRNAAAASIASLDAASRLSIIKAGMEGYAEPWRFYPMLAHTNTPEAVAIISEGYKAAPEGAVDAMLMVSAPAAIEPVFALASDEKAPRRDDLIRHYTRLVSATDDDHAQKYTRLGRAFELTPGDDALRELVAALGKLPTGESLKCTARYLDNDATAATAAWSASAILKANPALLADADNRATAQKAIDRFLVEKEKGNADAGYAADMLRGLLN